MGGQRTGRRPARAAGRFAAGESGLESVEFAIIAGLIVSGLVATILAIGNWVVRSLANLQQDLPGA